METIGASQGPQEGPKNSLGRPLPFSPIARPLRVVRIDAGRALAAHLADLGITVGSVVRVLRVGPFGPVMVGVGDSRYAIGRSAAIRVFAVVDDR